ncbi:MAG: hypothetical protein FJ276_33285 [Planctomycetes bacterium]|nr:hypothetical protein [Planctomycetota bacterium]
MKVIFKHDVLVLVPQSPDETAALSAWKDSRDDHVFRLSATEGVGAAFLNLGERSIALGEPINVISNSPDRRCQLISNFAHTPFVLDGVAYASVEGFWQSLKCDRQSDRRRVAAMWGKPAMRAGRAIPYEATVSYGDRQVVVGTWDHWQLMSAACWAKFAQDERAKAALLATGSRPLTHQTRTYCRTIPGVIMAEIWMKIRAHLGHGGDCGSVSGGREPARLCTGERRA